MQREHQLETVQHDRTYLVSDTKANLLNKIQDRQTKNAIVGLGYVGLPLAVSFAEAGLCVTGIDVNQERTNNLNSGRNYISDIVDSRLAGLNTKPHDTAHCLEVTQTLYECVITKVVPVSTTVTAEMEKLLENTFRAVNIALVNEMAIICDQLSVDVWEVIEAAKTKPFGFLPFYPGPSLGGHSIPVDPRFLAWKLKTLSYEARFIELAEKINFYMPLYVFEKITDALQREYKDLDSAGVLVLGVTYKVDVADIRESSALDLLHLLDKKGVKIAYTDPNVPKIEHDGRSIVSRSLNRKLLYEFDCVVIITDHKKFDWEWVVDNSLLIVDTRNATRNVSADDARKV